MGERAALLLLFDASSMQNDGRIKRDREVGKRKRYETVSLYSTRSQSQKQEPIYRVYGSMLSGGTKNNSS
jgi:hypothetical protein